MGDILEVSDDNFESEIVKSDIPSMVDFWAEWCGPCKKVGPVVEELAAEYEGKIKIAKMDVDSNRQTPAKFGIRNIPTLILFKNGEVVNTIVGAQPKTSIEEELKKLL
jgi:thioredoxin 1